MTRYILELDPMPSKHAYHDGEHYHCYKNRCIIERARVEECGRIPVSEDTYLPILRCQCCGSLYFGVHTRENETQHEPPSPPARQQSPESPHQEESIILPNLLTV